MFPSSPNKSNGFAGLDDSTAQLNQTSDSITSAASSTAVQTNNIMNSSSVVKRTPSLNDAHYSHAVNARLGPDPEAAQIYENLGGNTSSASTTPAPSVPTECISTQTDTRSPLRPVLQKEDSFIRTGSGRKLPKIPASKTATGPSSLTTSSGTASLPANFIGGSSSSSTLPAGTGAPSAPHPQMRQKSEDLSALEKEENRKSKPKALQFWESLETVERPSADFRYNTIHRMSMGRRMLPKPPGSESSANSCSTNQRSQSLDRSGEMACAVSSSDIEIGIGISSGSSNNNNKAAGGNASLNSSFSGPTSLPASSPAGRKYSESDGCSLSSSSGGGGGGQGGGGVNGYGTTSSSTTVPASQPSPPTSDTRGEVEGSSDNNNSPPTSVIQGDGAGGSIGWDKTRSNPAFDWIRGSTFERQQQSGGVNKVGINGVSAAPGSRYVRERTILNFAFLTYVHFMKAQCMSDVLTTLYISWVLGNILLLGNMLPRWSIYGGKNFPSFLSF